MTNSNASRPTSGSSNSPTNSASKTGDSAATTLASPSRSGAFSSGVDQRVERFSESISFDHQLYRQDIRGSLAHAQMLCECGLLTPAERDQIVSGLQQIEQEINAGTFAFDQRLEDIHMNIEQRLIDRLGDVGRKLHTARSRNDQIATDLRLWVRDQIDSLDRLLHELQLAFLKRCDLDSGVIIPAYTHLRRAQPVLAAHYWLAYIEKFSRDRERLSDCRRRANVNSLGCAALAGTSLPINRHRTAELLEFADVARNSLDVSSDRDFLLEFAFCLSVIGIHLSGWAEEWILWSTTEFDFLELPHAFCTGSSIMPQKINPDTLELTRGKSASVVGALQTLLILVKGLPLAYNRDLQEDKPPVFQAARTVLGTLEVAIPVVEQARLKRPSIASRLDSGFLDATTFMEYLIKTGVPQRTAHHHVGDLVRLATQKQCRLADLSLADFESFGIKIDNSVYDVLGAEASVQAFVSYGSTAPAQVQSQIEFWRSRLEQSANLT